MLGSARSPKRVIPLSDLRKLYMIRIIILHNVNKFVNAYMKSLFTERAYIKQLMLEMFQSNT